MRASDSQQSDILRNLTDAFTPRLSPLANPAHLAYNDAIRLSQALSGHDQYFSLFMSLPVTPFKALTALNIADLSAPMLGIPGAQAFQLYHAIQDTPPASQSPVAWADFFHASQVSKNLVLVIRALKEKSNAATDPSQQHAASIILGHYMRFVANDLPEAIQAYRNAATANWDEALCALLSLRRLHRAAPQFDEAKSAIRSIQSSFPLNIPSQDTLVATLSQLATNDNQNRVKTYLQLAVATLLEWGDASGALNWLDMALSISPDYQGLANVASAIAIAMPDNAPALTHTLHILEKCNEPEQLAKLTKLLSFNIFKLSTQHCVILSMLCAKMLREPQKAARFLYLAALNNPHEFQTLVQEQAWICAYAAEYPDFCIALSESLKLIEDPVTIDNVRTYFERFSNTPTGKFGAALERTAHLIRTQQFARAIKKLNLIIRELPHSEAFEAFSLMSSAIQFSAQTSCTAFNAQLLSCAETLHKRLRNDALYCMFLTELLDATESIQIPSHDTIALKTSIQAKLSNLASTTHDPEEPLEEEPILAACLSFIDQGNISQARHAFFDWFETGADLQEALTIFDKLDAASEARASHTASVNTAHIPLILAVILQPQDPDLVDQLETAEDISEEAWLCIARKFIQYLPDVSLKDELATVISHICCAHIKPADAFTLLTDNILTSIRQDILLNQVILMSENTNQQKVMLAKLEESLATFKGDKAQRNILLAQKFKIAETLGDERMKMSCLKEMIEASHSDPFAVEALNKIDPETLKPHSQILYFQLKLYTDTSMDGRLHNQMQLASLYASTSQFNNAITLYHAIIDEYPEFLEARYKLLDLLVSLENWKSVENVLSALIQAEPTPQNRIQCLVRLAAIQNEHMLAPSMALQSLFSALDLDPAKLPALHAKLCDVCEKLHAFTPLIEKYETILQQTAIPALRRTATIYLAKIYSENLQKPALASNTLNEYYTHGGSQDPEFLRKALDIFQALDIPESIILYQSSLISFSSDSAEKIARSLQNAHLYLTRLDDVANAAICARNALQFGPDTAQQFTDIATILTLCNDVTFAAQALILASQHADAPHKKAQYLLETTRLLAQKDELAQAAAYFHEAILLSPSVELITPFAENLIAVSTSLGDKDAFNSICSDLVQACPKADRSPLLMQQALSLVRYFDDAETAVRIINQNFNSFDDLDIEQSFTLATLLTEISENKAAIQLLIRVLTAPDITPEQTIDCLTLMLNNAVDINEIPIVKKAANALLEIDPNDAFANYQLFELDYHSGNWDRATERIKRILPFESNLSEDNALFMHYQYGEILHAAQNNDLAVAQLNLALRLRPDFRPAADLKLTILLEQERWIDALPAFDQLLALTDDIEVQGAIHKRIAEIHHFYLNDLFTAVKEYETALALGGDVEDVPIRLLHLYQLLGMWEKAAMTAKVLAMAQVNSTTARCEYLYTLGQIQGEHLKTTPEAVNTMLEAFSLDPTNAKFLTYLAKQLLIAEDWQKISGVFEHLDNLYISRKPGIIEQLVRFAQLIGYEPMLQSALSRVNSHIRQTHPDINLIEEAKKSPRPPKTTFSQELPRLDMSARRRVPTVRQVSFAPNPDSAPDLQKSSEPQLAPIETEDTRVQAPPQKPQVITQNLFPIPATLSTAATKHAIENAAFTLEELKEIEASANATHAQFTLRILDDLFDLIPAEHAQHDILPLPSELSPETRNTLLTVTPAFDPQLVALLKALTHSNAPVIDNHAVLSAPDITKINPDLDCVFETIQSLLDLPGAVLKSKPLDARSNMINSTPPAILCDIAALPVMKKSTYIARMTYAIILTRPETLLSATLAPAALHKHLNNAVYAISPGRAEKVSLIHETISTYQQIFEDVGIHADELPIIGPKTLTTLKQYAFANRQTAIQTALILSQSLRDCMHLVAEQEGMRLPASFTALKAAMKRSIAFRDLITFALSPSAQSLFEQVYPDRETSRA